MRLVWAILVLAAGCNSGPGKQPGASSTTAPIASVSAPSPSSSAPAGCKADRQRPTSLGSITGDVEAMTGDATRLYYVSWDIYGNRGNLGAIRKDGGGSTRVTSLDLEPRGLFLDGEDVYYTSGIRLARIPKAGGDPNVFSPEFAAQKIAPFGEDVYGIPGDYGPYDRVARVSRKGGEIKELASSKRPKTELRPTGFSALLVDATSVYVTDSGGDRVLEFSRDKGVRKVLASGQPKAFDLARVGSNLYFTLARKGDLMTVPTGGGTAKKLASDLAQEARIAADEKGVFATRVGKADEPQTLTRIALDGSEITPVATVAAADTVPAIALDADCVYWVVRSQAGGTTAYALGR